MRRLLISSGVFASCAGVAMLGAPAALAFCGSLCNPQAAALAAEVSANGVAPAVAVPAGFAGPVAASTLPVASKVLSLGAAGVGATAGSIWLANGGMLPWDWAAPAEAQLPVQSGQTAPTYYVPAGYTGGTLGGSSTYSLVGQDYSTTYEIQVNGSHKAVKAYCVLVTAPAPTAQDIYNDEMGTPNNPDITATTSFYSSTTARTSYTYTGTTCTGSTGTPKRLAGLFVFDSTAGTRWAATVPQGTPKAVNGRHLEQTVTCKRPDGTTYTISNVTTVFPSMMSAVAGLMCTTGDRARDAHTDLVTTYSDSTTSRTTVAAPAPSGDIYTDGQATPTGSRIESDPGLQSVTQYWVDNSTGPTTTINNVTNLYPDTGADPGSAADLEQSGTNWCGMSWSSVLDGSVVYKAMTCALSYAFVPAGGLQPYMTRATTAWSTSAVGTWLGDVTGIGGDLGSQLASSGCSGPVWMIPLGGEEYRFAPLDACTEPMATIATVVKIAVTALLVIAGFKALARPITQALGLPKMPGGVS